MMTVEGREGLNAGPGPWAGDPRVAVVRQRPRPRCGRPLVYRRRGTGRHDPPDGRGGRLVGRGCLGGGSAHGVVAPEGSGAPVLEKLLLEAPVGHGRAGPHSGRLPAGLEQRKSGIRQGG